MGLNANALVWHLDRLGRSMINWVLLVKNVKSRKIEIRSICDGAIDTTTVSGELSFNILHL
ncbi:putative recombinase domain protein [Candidatus Hepatincolaceae symbiont of Richtersius coronifer]